MKMKNVWVLGTLMIIGEFIFLLPFILTRIFRPTFLTVFGINNFELGSSFSVYGIVAMISYFAGGPLADRFAPRQLLPVALILTSFGGVFLYSIPSVWTLSLLYGFWGMTTILLFWAGYIKAQRELGGLNAQGKSFGSIDAGRGLVSAILASGSVFLLDALLPVSADQASTVELTRALQSVIILFSILTASGAFLVWIFLKGEQFEKDSMPRLSIDGIKSVIGRKTIWLQALIVLTAYVGYKCTDDFSLFAKDTLGYNDVDAAYLATVTFWVRPFAAVAAGVLGDRFIHSHIIMWCFSVMIVGSLVIGLGLLESVGTVVIILTIASTSAAIYGIRGLYYALFQEAHLPLLITGSATGLVAVIGYTPDIFMGPLMGVLLDSNPGTLGHQYLFGVLALFSIIGLIGTLIFTKKARIHST